MKSSSVKMVAALVMSAFFAAGTCGVALAQDKAPAAKAQMAKKKAVKKQAGSSLLKSVQEALVKAGYDLKVDGRKGPKTRAAIKDFQQKNGLKVTGKADKATQAKLGLK